MKLTIKSLEARPLNAKLGQTFAISSASQDAVTSVLVTLSLCYVTGYHGDACSVDSVLRGDPEAYRRRRPFFIQRLLQLQLAFTFWHTALGKTHLAPAGAALIGNWLTDNPYYYLMHYPPLGVVRDFPLRALLGQHPALCYGLGVLLIIAETILPVLWFVPKTRPVGLAIGIGFQIMLLATLHVPTIFFFLFPPQMLLFVNPERIVRWIEARRARTALSPRPILLYDGRCGFCLLSVRRLKTLDVFGRIDPVDFHGVADLTHLHPALTEARCRSRMQLIEPHGMLTEGFDSARRLCLRLPLAWPLATVLYLPGARWVGRRVYDWVAGRRFGFHAGQLCQTNQCAIRSGETSPSSNT